MKNEIINRVKGFNNMGNSIKVVYANYVDGPSEHYLHLNKLYEMYIYIDGDADYIVDENYYSLTPYDVIFINPYVPHKVVLKSTGNYKRFYILIPQDYFNSMMMNPLNTLLEITKGNHLISMDKKSKEKIANLLTYFEKENESSGVSGYASFVRILEIFELLLSSEHMQQAANQNKHVPEIVHSIMKEIDNSDKYDITLSELARNFKLSESQLSKIFKKHTTVGVKHYILMKKIGKSKELLGTGCSITEACFGSGFNDCSYFTKIFKKCTGITPGQYKEIMEESDDK